MTHKRVFKRAFLTIGQRHIVEPFDEGDAIGFRQGFDQRCVLMRARSMFSDILSFVQNSGSLIC